MGVRVREDYRSITGQEKAAILLMSLAEEQAAKLFAQLDDEEIKEISQVMARSEERVPTSSSACSSSSPTSSPPPAPWSAPTTQQNACS